MNALNQNEEFVTELFVTFDKMQLLIHELLVAETWKSKVLPHLLKDIARQDSLKSYFLVHFSSWSRRVNLSKVELSRSGYFKFTGNHNVQ